MAAMNSLSAASELFSEWEKQTKKMTPEGRLIFHQTFSEPEMLRLRSIAKGKIEEKRAEPNSRLGKAYAYVIRHYEKLTEFLRQSGAPLENNEAERQLKAPIRSLRRIAGGTRFCEGGVQQ